MKRCLGMVYMVVASLVLGSLTACLVAGCVVDLTGEGKVGVGYSSTGELYSTHTVEQEKEGIKARSELDVAPLVDLILKLQKAKDEQEEVPADSTGTLDTGGGG